MTSVRHAPLVTSKTTGYSEAMEAEISFLSHDHKPVDISVIIECPTAINVGGYFFQVSNMKVKAPGLSQPEIAVELLKLVLSVMMDKSPDIRWDFINYRDRESQPRAQLAGDDDPQYFRMAVRFDGTPHCSEVMYKFGFEKVKELYESID